MFHLGFSPYVFEQGDTLNSGYSKISNFVAITGFPTATPACTMRPLQLVAKVQHFKNAFVLFQHKFLCFFFFSFNYPFLFLSISSAVKS